MTNNLFLLEFFPNEILIDIFQYFDARDLFQAFYNLNSRWNALLRSLKDLSLTFSASDPHEIDDLPVFSHCIRTMIDGREVIGNFNDFPNLRRLELSNPESSQLHELNSANLPYLERLSIGPEKSWFSWDDHHCEKIFSNGFPNLISCYLFQPMTMPKLLGATQSTQLRFLTVNNIHIFAYRTILSACPNLYFFRFTLSCVDEKSLILESHLNLKRMVIKFDEHTEILNDYNLEDYLACVPNLEQLCLYRQNCDTFIEPYLDYNWLAKLIDRYLPSLRRFKCHFGIYKARGLIECDHESLLYRLKERFKHVHNNRYQSKLVLELYPQPLSYACC